VLKLCLYKLRLTGLAG